MDYKCLGKTGTMVSELCLGTMTFGREVDEAGSKEILDRFLEAGGNFVDTADVYEAGVSEEITGRAIKDVRDDLVLATKVRFPMGEGPNDVGISRKHIIAGCEASLRRLGTDYIDLYQVHAWDAATPLEETLRANESRKEWESPVYWGLEFYGLAAREGPVHERAKRVGEVRLPAAAVLAGGA